MRKTAMPGYRDFLYRRQQLESWKKVLKQTKYIESGTPRQPQGMFPLQEAKNAMEPLAAMLHQVLTQENAYTK